MIALIFFLFYCVNLSCADSVIVLSDYISAVDNFVQYGIIKEAPTQFFGPIETFHTTFRTASPGGQRDLVKALILRGKSLTESSEEVVLDEAKKIWQSAAMQHSKLSTAYKNRLVDCVGKKMTLDILTNKAINFYHRFIVHSIDQNDQLYYQIQYIKNLRVGDKQLSPEMQRYLIMSLVDNIQTPLFVEQGKKRPDDVIFTIAHYYDEAITQDLMEEYFTFKNSFESKLDLKDPNRLQEAQIIEKQKIFLMTMAYLRGFWAHSSFILFAKDPDGDCGNYCIDVYNINKEEKYGAMNSIRLLKQNSDTLTIETINRLYPSQNKASEITIEKKDQSHKQPPQQQKKFIGIRLISLIFCFLKMIYKYCCAFWHTQENVTRNDGQASLSANKHGSVSDAQYEKIKLQIIDFKNNRNDNEAFKAFLESLYTNENYSVKYLSCWFKYCHVKEALTANTLLRIKIRLLVGYDKLEEVTPQEPCYNEGSRDVYVWTDNTAYHDSVLVPFYCFALMAKELRFENRYFNLNPCNKEYLATWQARFDTYKKEWIKIYPE
jgi:hypothetical protein